MSRIVYNIIERGAEMQQTKARPTAKEADKRETPTMSKEQLKVKVEIQKNLQKPERCVKSDVIFYDNNAGRVNYWITVDGSNNYDIISYYFTYKDAVIRLFSDSGEIKAINF